MFYRPRSHFWGPASIYLLIAGQFEELFAFYLVLSEPYTHDGFPAAVLKVASVEHRLDAGQFLLWDDTFEHEAWNASDEVRIVLLLDIWRHGMPVDMRILSAMLIRFVRIGIRVRGIG
jgi:aspartate beta-hydroxylase